MLKHCWRRAFFAQRRPLLDEPHDTTACSVPRADRQAGRGHVRPGTGEFRRRCRAAQGGRAGVPPRQGVRPVSGRQACAGEDSAHARRPDRPAGLRHRVRPFRTRTMPTTSPRIPSTSCCWGGTRSPAIFFNGFYDTWCYLPLLAFVTFGREAEQYLCAAVLRSGKAVASEGAVALLSGFAAAAAVRVSAGAVPCSARRGLCDTGGLRLPGCRPAARLRHLDTEERARTARSSRTEHVYGETRYAAGSWKQQRRVVIKAEVVRLAGREPRDNPRFVVTNLGRPPRSLYEKVYQPVEEVCSLSWRVQAVWR